MPGVLHMPARRALEFAGRRRGQALIPMLRASAPPGWRPSSPRSNQHVVFQRHGAMPIRFIGAPSLQDSRSPTSDAHVRLGRADSFAPTLLAHSSPALPSLLYRLACDQVQSWFSPDSGVLRRLWRGLVPSRISPQDTILKNRPDRQISK